MSNIGPWTRPELCIGSMVAVPSLFEELDLENAGLLAVGFRLGRCCLRETVAASGR